MLRRSYFECRFCTFASFMADQWFSINSFTIEARKRIVHESVNQAFGPAANNLKEYHNIHISANTVRAIAQEEGKKILAWQRNDKAASEDFIKTNGVVEFTTDGVMVNTYSEKEGEDNWREMKVAMVSKRDLGDYATPETMDTRTLPSPKQTVAIAAIESSEKFTARWIPLLKRLRVFDFEYLHVLADGARWIWEAADKKFFNYQGCLDFYHASQTIHDALNELCETETEKDRLFDQWRKTLLHEGWIGIRDTIHNAQVESGSEQEFEVLQKLYNYFSKHTEHLNYKSRLANGFSIGSGQIEGANKQLVTRRLKQTGARWRIQRVNRMIGLVIAYRHNFINKYWNYCYNTIG